MPWRGKVYQAINRRPNSAIKKNKRIFLISTKHVSLNNISVAFHFSNKRLLFSTGYHTIQPGCF